MDVTINQIDWTALGIGLAFVIASICGAIAVGIKKIKSALRETTAETVQATRENTEAVKTGNAELAAVRRETQALRVVATGAIPAQAPPNSEPSE